MRRFGLIGRPLGHSASAAYFTEKFAREGLSDHAYALYELPSIEALPGLLEQHPDLYRAIADAGHKVGNHSYSHIKGWGMATGQYVADVDLANQLVESDIFRPPYGRIRRRQCFRSVTVW